MTLETKLIAFAQAIGADVKTLTNNTGSLTSLTTTAKTNIVNAINEIHAALSASGAAINDAGTTTTVTWSASKIQATIDAAKVAVTNSLVNGSAVALDTLSELATALGNDPSFATTIATQIGNRVRFDAAQTLTAPQITQALANIGAQSSASVGNTERDLVADYVAAKV